MIRLTLLITMLFLAGVVRGNDTSRSLKSDFKTGNPQILSVNALAFGPEGILFIGDSKRAEIFALDTQDDNPSTTTQEISVEGVDQQIADLLGTTPDAVTIQDMAVNPISKKVYVAVHVNDGTPILLRLEDQNFQNVALTSVSFSKSGLNMAVTKDAVDRRGRPLRKWAISDLAYYQGQVMVSGLSSEEFSSTFSHYCFPIQ